MREITFDFRKAYVVNHLRYLAGMQLLAQLVVNRMVEGGQDTSCISLRDAESPPVDLPQAGSEQPSSQELITNIGD